MGDVKTHEGLRICPACQYVFEQFTGDGGRAPAAGDLGVCIQCFAYLTFTEDNMRVITADEFNALHPDSKAGLQKMRFTLSIVQPMRRRTEKGAH